jgi:hypothetical protein
MSQIRITLHAFGRLSLGTSIWQEGGIVGMHANACWFVGYLVHKLVTTACIICNCMLMHCNWGVEVNNI